MRIDSWKKSVNYGLLYAVITFGVFTVFTCFVHYILLQGEEFIGKDETVYYIRGISFYTVNAVGVVLSMMVPILFLRYKSIKYLPLNLLVSSIFYCLLYIVFLCFGEIISFGLLYPLENFDTIIYAIIAFPIGSFIGSIIAIVINAVNKKLMINTVH